MQRPAPPWAHAPYPPPEQPFGDPRHRRPSLQQGQPGPAYYNAPSTSQYQQSPAPAFPVPQIPTTLMPGRVYSTPGTAVDTLCFGYPASGSVVESPTSIPHPHPYAHYRPPGTAPPAIPQYGRSNRYDSYGSTSTPPPPPVPPKPMQRAQSVPPPPPILSQAPAVHRADMSTPTMYRAEGPPPVLPAKIPLYPSHLQSSVLQPSTPDDPKSPSSDDEDDVHLAQALQMSLNLHHERHAYAQDEEQQLAQALAESQRLEELRQAAQRITPARLAPVEYSRSRRPSATSPNSTNGSNETSGSSTSHGDSVHTNATSLSSHPSSEDVRREDAQWRSPAEFARLEQMKRDEALARRLAEEDAAPQQPIASSSSSPISAPIPPPPPSGPPAYNGPPSPRAPAQAPMRQSPPAPSIEVTPARSFLDLVPVPASAPALQSQPSMMRARSANAVVPVPVGGRLSIGPTKPRSSSVGDLSALSAAQARAAVSSGTRPLSMNVSAATLPSVGEGDEEPEDGELSRAPALPDTMLLGVSIGFGPPAITTTLAPMQGPMPNVIALPYGKCPPLHFQAPTWRHMMKLLARLSTTRIEPTVEAMAINKTELKLRTVVQFVRAHQSSSDWRCILYLTIDHPPPQSNTSWKYTNGNVDSLPFSYTLSTVPALLRDGDSTLARTYTVPETPQTPHPTLPIECPNLVHYLQSALADSRRAAHDSSSGVRKLARMVDDCAPAIGSEEVLGSMEGPDEQGRARRFMDRFRRTRQRSGANAQTYDLITPFMADGYA